MDHQESPKENEGKALVDIFMNNNPEPYKVHRGHQTVPTIKTACGVPQTEDIELIGENGQLRLLSDTDALTIHGGEKFISHKRGGGSS